MCVTTVTVSFIFFDNVFVQLSDTASSTFYLLFFMGCFRLLLLYSFRNNRKKTHLKCMDFVIISFTLTVLVLHLFVIIHELDFGWFQIEDQTDVLDRKCQELAQMIQSAKNAIVYTGAGISTVSPFFKILYCQLSFCNADFIVLYSVFNYHQARQIFQCCMSPCVWQWLGTWWLNW